MRISVAVVSAGETGLQQPAAHDRIKIKNTHKHTDTLTLTHTGASDLHCLLQHNCEDMADDTLDTNSRLFFSSLMQSGVLVGPKQREKKNSGTYSRSAASPSAPRHRDDVQRHGRAEADMNIPRQTSSNGGICRIQGRNQSALPAG